MDIKTSEQFYRSLQWQKVCARLLNGSMTLELLIKLKSFSCIFPRLVDEDSVFLEPGETGAELTKRFLYTINTLLQKLGFRFVNPINGAAERIADFADPFWKRPTAEGTEPVEYMIFLRILESLTAAGFLSHGIQLFNVLQEAWFTKSVLVVHANLFKKHIHPLLQRLVANYTALDTVTQKLTFKRLNPLLAQLPTPLPAELDVPVFTASALLPSKTGANYRVPVCLHGVIAGLDKSQPQGAVWNCFVRGTADCGFRLAPQTESA